MGNVLMSLSFCLLFVSCICLIFRCIHVVFFFFKQKTAYDMRISDWSSDVCSSDLAILNETQSASRHCIEPRKDRYHSRDHPFGGKLRYCPAEKDIGIIKKVGATKKNNIAMLTTLSQILPIIHSCESILRVAVPGQTTRGKAMGQRHQGKRRNQQQHAQRADRKSVGEGKRVTVGEAKGGRRSN